MPSVIRSFIVIVLFSAIFITIAPHFSAVRAQSLSPMQKDGLTPSATKGFKLVVGNPYGRKMTFVLVPMADDYQSPVAGAVVKPARLTLAPGRAKPVIFMFDIDPQIKERTIALCITPEAVDGPILPRVCGRYTGRMR
jgi:hypothetical protein